MKKSSRGYKGALRDLVHKLGGLYIDTMWDGSKIITNTKVPKWLIEFAESFGKEPKQVLEDIVKYRNSWPYELRKQGIK